MSAYLVNRNHITYILESALEINGRNTRYNPEEFNWCDASGALQVLTRENMESTGRMLRQANIDSVADLYQHRPITDFLEEGESLEYEYRPSAYQWDPVQVLKALEAYAYQCRFQDSNPQDADRLTRQIAQAAIWLLPGYPQSEWGAPKPQA